METVCDRETAKAEFDRWADAMRIDMDMEGLDANDARDKALDERTFIKAMMEGRLAVTDENFVEFTPDGGDPITFGKVKGSALAAMDKAKKTEDVGKVYKAMAEMTKAPPVTFSKMDVADTKICMAIATLFLA